MRSWQDYQHEDWAVKRNGYDENNEPGTLLLEEIRILEERFINSRGLRCRLERERENQ
jgi:hypothetical protein